MSDHPMKIFKCDCTGEGLSVIVSHDIELDDCSYSPFIEIAFWEQGHKICTRWTFWNRLRMAWHVFRKGTPWPDMVIFDNKGARQFAYHILYLANKKKDMPKKKQESLVKYPKGVGSCPA